MQRDGAKLIIPARPGKQTIAVAWNTSDSDGHDCQSPVEVELPVEASNITTVMMMPPNRWILWADGPLRGPAVRFWTILAIAILAALALGSVPLSPLRRWEWVLLAIGLTQVHLMAAMTVVAWLFVLAWRGCGQKIGSRVLAFNLLQLGIILLTFVSLIILMFVVGAGLLGNPDMFIVGNGSSRTYLQWFLPRSGPGTSRALRRFDFGVVLSFTDVVLGTVVGNGATAVAEVGMATIQQRRCVASKIEKTGDPTTRKLARVRAG